MIRKPRIRLRPMTRRYLLPTTEDAGDRYVSPPPDPDDGPARYGVVVPERRRLSMGPVFTAGEAFALFCDDHADRLTLWRTRHPESADVHDGVRSTEAAVMPVEETFTLDGEADE